MFCKLLPSLRVLCALRGKKTCPPIRPSAHSGLKTIETVVPKKL